MEKQSKVGSGKVLDFFLPGMISINGKTGLYPAVSITGKKCSLQCEHCHGSLLEPMYDGDTPEKLLNIIRAFEKDRMIGALITGGCDKDGRLPWSGFLPVLKDLKTKLFLSAHSGINVSKDLASGLRAAGIRQALIDVIGDEATAKEIYHIDNFKIVTKSIENLYSFGPKVIPHLIVGVYKGRISGEYIALDLIAGIDNSRIEIVVIMPKELGVDPPEINEVIKVFEYARKKFKKVALGCARPRGKYRFMLEEKLIEAGLIDRLAIWSDRAISIAKEKGYKVNFHYTCCSVDPNEV